MVILHIYGARGIFLLFYDDKDTLSTKCKIKMSISQLMFTHKNIKSLYGTMISILYKTGEKIVTILHIYGDRAMFLLLYDDQDTVST